MLVYYPYYIVRNTTDHHPSTGDRHATGSSCSRPQPLESGEPREACDRGLDQCAYLRTQAVSSDEIIGSALMVCPGTDGIAKTPRDRPE